MNDAKSRTNNSTLDVRLSSSSLLSRSKSETEPKYKTAANYINSAKLPCSMTTEPTSSSLFQQNISRLRTAEAKHVQKTCAPSDAITKPIRKFQAEDKAFLGYTTPNSSTSAKSILGTTNNKIFPIFESARTVSTIASGRGKCEPINTYSLPAYNYPACNTDFAVMSKSRKRPVSVSNTLSSASSVCRIDRRRIMSHEPKKASLGSQRDKRTVSTQFGARCRNVGVQVKTPRNSIGVQKSCVTKSVLTQTESSQTAEKTNLSGNGKKCTPRKVKMKVKNLKQIINKDADLKQISGFIERNVTTAVNKHRQSINLPSLNKDTSNTVLMLQCHLKDLDKKGSLESDKVKPEYILPSILHEKQYLEMFSGFEKSLEQIIFKLLNKHTKARQKLQGSNQIPITQSQDLSNDVSCSDNILEVDNSSKHDLSAISFGSTLEAMSTQDLAQVSSKMSFMESSQTSNPSCKTVSAASVVCDASDMLDQLICSSVSTNPPLLTTSEFKCEKCDDYGAEPSSNDNIKNTHTCQTDKLEEDSVVMSKQRLENESLKAPISSTIESSDIERIPVAEESESMEFEAVNVTDSQNPIGTTLSGAEESALASSSLLVPEDLLIQDSQDSESLQLEISMYQSGETYDLDASTSSPQTNILENNKLHDFKKSSNDTVKHKPNETRLPKIYTKLKTFSDNMQGHNILPSSESHGLRLLQQPNSTFHSHTFHDEETLTMGKMMQNSDASKKGLISKVLKHNQTTKLHDDCEVSSTALYLESNLVNVSKVQKTSRLTGDLAFPQIKPSISLHGVDEFQEGIISICHKDEDSSLSDVRSQNEACPKNPTFQNPLCQIDGYLPAITSVEITSPEAECFHTYTAKFSKSAEPLYETHQNHILSSSEDIMALETCSKISLPSNQMLAQVTKSSCKKNLVSKVAFMLPAKGSIFDSGLVNLFFCVITS